MLDESCSPANNAVDPGEVVTMDLGLTNVGTDEAQNLTADLRESGGIVPVTTTQSYGPIEEGASATRSFRFIAHGTCGAPLTVTLDLSDGATQLGAVSFHFTLGPGGSDPVCLPTGTGPKPVPDGKWSRALPCVPRVSIPTARPSRWIGT